MGKSRGTRGPGPAMESFSEAVSRWSGSTWAFVSAAALVLGWLVTGPLFGFSDTWQLVINTATTVLTFLMVFLIQRAQNKDARAVALKLNELIAAVKGASDRLIDLESLSERELEMLTATTSTWCAWRRATPHSSSRIRWRKRSLATGGRSADPRSTS